MDKSSPLAEHDLIEISDAHGVKLLECPVCPRSILFGPGKYEVLESGDFSATHSWSSEELTLTTRLV